MSLEKALKRIQEAKEKKANSLYLTGLNLKEIPIEVAELTQLIRLNLNNGRISKINRLENLLKLVSLNLGNNHISEIKGLEKLTQLIRLDLEGNQISEIEHLEKLKNLT